MTILPGIYFKTGKRMAGEALPRTDIAAFAGFASCGPVGIPVAVESSAAFADIFGPDLDIAWETKDGGFQTALLGPAVRAFFSNGGARCYVVRLACRSSDASAHVPVTHTIGLPGMVRCNPRRSTAAACAPARCPGSWADTLRVMPVADVEGIAFDFTGKKNDGTILTSSRPSPALSRGDLLRLCFVDSDKQELHEFISIAGINADASAIIPGTTVCVKKKSIDGSPTTVLLPSLKNGTHRCRCLLWSGHNAGGQLPVLTVKKHHEAYVPLPGMVLPVHLKSGTTAIVEVDHCAVTQYSDSPPQEAIDIAVRRSWEIVKRPLDFFKKGRYIRAERITISIVANDASGRAWRIDDLGLCPVHERAWTNLPSDDDCFSPPDSPMPEDQSPETALLWRETMQPRFPLAGLATSAGTISVPIGLLDTVSESHGAPLGDTDPKTRIERDGLARLDASLFLDSRLADVASYRLYETAKALRYCSVPQSSVGLRGEAPLQGIHSLFFIEEISLLAVPDALLTGWTRSALADTSDGRKADRDRFLRAPDISVDSYDQNGAVVIARAVPGATSYVLADGKDADFSDTALNIVESSGGLATFVLKPDETCPRLHFIKIQAVADGRVSLWSKTIAMTLPIRVFTEDAETAAEAPELHAAPSKPAGTVRLTWSGVKNAQTYRLQRSVDPEFTTAESMELIQHEIIIEMQKGSLFRIQAISGGKGGPWSATLAPAVTGGNRLRMRSPEEYDAPGDCFGRKDLMRIHAAMLRMCASRGDMFMIAGLPRHYSTASANRYLHDMGNSLSDEAKAISYGAFYAPWLLLDDETTLTPDGPMAGITARLSLTSGPWRAPANIFVTSGKKLTSHAGDPFQSPETGSGINLLRERPEGLTVWSCRTLSETREPTAINARMLLILVRRLAMREGNSLLFENNGPALQEYLEYRFTRLFSDLFTSGAFAGATESESFQVKVATLPDNALQSSYDNGRLFVELSVAPSLPMEFLTVTFSIVEHESLHVEEV